MTSPEHTIILWGAGATASLGMQTTQKQTKAIKELASVGGRVSLDKRIRIALNCKGKEPLASALRDLLIILGDDEEGWNPAVDVTPKSLDVMSRHWPQTHCSDELRSRVFFLRTLYDWPALKAAIKVCPGVQGERFQLNDLFNVLDMHSQSGHGFRVEEDVFLTPQRILGAYNALKMLLHAILYINWQWARKKNKLHLKHHYDFARALSKRMQKEGKKLAKGPFRFDNSTFYMGDVAHVCFNWDPIVLWCQFVANRDLNDCAPKVDSYKLKIFHDLGHFVPGPRVKKGGRSRQTPWHPMNESSVLQLNDKENGASVRIRISKFLLPHGCLWWRECPNCGKLSSYMGNDWKVDSPTLIPPPPLKAFVQGVAFKKRNKKERKIWDSGAVDARACIHCDTTTYADHTQMTMQSSFKSPPPPFLDEIKRDLRIAIQKADHVVLMGYSLPPDDVDYRAFLAARRRRDRGSPVRCSVVTRRDEHDKRWYGPSACDAILEDNQCEESLRDTLRATRDLFGKENVRFYGGGIPNVFLDEGKVTDSVVEKLLRWSEQDDVSDVLTQHT